MMSEQSRPKRWSLITNHGAVLLHLADHPDDTVLSMASQLGLRERAVAAILRDLREARYIEAQKRGRGRHYVVRVSQPAPASHSEPGVGQIVAAFRLGTVPSDLS
jgi:hypothetical protein